MQEIKINLFFDIAFNFITSYVYVISILNN